MRYFARPFPGRSGFAAYRMPGPAFHVSFLLVMLVIGLALCFTGPTKLTWPLLGVWLVVGLYLGRDLAILAHYNGLLVLAWLAGVIAAFVPGVPDAAFSGLQAFAQAHHPEAAVAITATLAALFALWVRRWLRRDGSA